MSKQLEWAKQIEIRYRYTEEPTEYEEYLLELAQAIIADSEAV